MRDFGANAALERLRAATSPVPDEVPAGWRTSTEWAEKFNLSESHTRKLLARGVRNGGVKSKSFRVASGGRRMPVHHFLIIGKIK